MTKHYGISGVGPDIQLGKAGGRLLYSGSLFKLTESDGSTLETLQVATPVNDDDAVTKAYVDGVSAGLDPKESVRVATTADPGGSYNSSGGTGGTGEFTAMANTIDGVSLALNDRILVKDDTTQTQNGIYVVTTVGTGANGVWERAEDHDGSPAGEVSSGNYVFVEQGTDNANTGWVLQGDGILTLNSDNLVWALFSASGDVIAGAGLTKSGNTLALDIDSVPNYSDTLVSTDTIVVKDVSDSNNTYEATLSEVIADLGIVTETGSNLGTGIVVGNGSSAPTNVTITASSVAGDEGISVTNGNGTGGNPTIGIDIVGQSNLTTDSVDDADELLIYHSVAGGTEGIGNYAITAAKLKSYMTAGTSSSSITDGDTTLQVTDAGTGEISFDFDGGTGDVVITAASSTFNNNVTVSTGNTLTVADLTNNDVLIAGTGGLVEDSGGLFTFNGTTLALTGAFDITGDLDVDNININGNTISSTAGTDLNITPLAGQQLVLDGTIIVDAGSMTGLTTLGLDSVSLTAVQTSGEGFADNDTSIMTSAAIDDRILSYNYSTTTGTVTSSDGVDNRVAVFTSGTNIEGDGNFTWSGSALAITGGVDVTGDLDVDNINLNGNTLSITDTNGNLIIQPNGTGQITLANGSGEEVLELQDTASAINGLSIIAGATGVAPTIGLGTGSETNVDINFTLNGTGVIAVTAGTGNYEDNVTADDDIPNKKYVDDQISTVAGGNVDSISGTVDLTSATAQSIGTIPANAVILRTLLDVDTASDTTTTVTVGDPTNGAAAYMAAIENDPEATDTYITDTYLANGGAGVTANATVATAGTTGSATCVIEFRLTG
jgi:hypothetical protein